MSRGSVAQNVPVRRAGADGPPPEYDRLRREDPVARRILYDGTPAWLVTRLDDAKQILADPVVSNDRTDARFPMLRSNRSIALAIEKPLNFLEGEEHVRYRRLVAPEFSKKRVQSLEPRLQAVIDGVVSDMIDRGPDGDIVHDVALPVASTVICEMLGVPQSDHAFFQRESARLIQRYAPPEEFQDALGRLGDYLTDLVKSKSIADQDGIISRLHGRVDSGELRESQLISLAFLLLFAGHETSANVIALGTYTLLTRPEQRSVLRENPDLYGAAVSELLRYHSITDDVTARFATADTVLNDVEIRAGDKIVVSALAANHDPSAFERPDELDFTRNSAEGLAFGYGPHTCLGQNLARAELAMTFETLFRRIPTLRLAVDVSELEFKYESVTWGLHALPVTWDVGSRS